jgi:hypothetical protein
MTGNKHRITIFHLVNRIKDQTMNAEITQLPLVWQRAETYCLNSGDPSDTVKERIRTGLWAAGIHYKRTGPRTLWINLPEVTKWISQQPHIEAYSQGASNFVRGLAERN